MLLFINILFYIESSVILLNKELYGIIRMKNMILVLKDLL